MRLSHKCILSPGTRGMSGFRVMDYSSLGTRQLVWILSVCSLNSTACSQCRQLDTEKNMRQRHTKPAQFLAVCLRRYTHLLRSQPLKPRPSTCSAWELHVSTMPCCNAAKRGSQSKDCELAIVKNELDACKAQAGAAAGEAAAKQAHQAAAARARHDACMQEYSRSFGKQVTWPETGSPAQEYGGPHD